MGSKFNADLDEQNLMQGFFNFKYASNLNIKGQAFNGIFQSEGKKDVRSIKRL